MAKKVTTKKEPVKKAEKPVESLFKMKTDAKSVNAALAQLSRECENIEGNEKMMAHINKRLKFTVTDGKDETEKILKAYLT